MAEKTPYELTLAGAALMTVGFATAAGASIALAIVLKPHFLPAALLVLPGLLCGWASVVAGSAMLTIAHDRLKARLAWRRMVGKGGEFAPARRHDHHVYLVADREPCKLEDGHGVRFLTKRKRFSEIFGRWDDIGDVDIQELPVETPVAELSSRWFDYCARVAERNRAEAGRLEEIELRKQLELEQAAEADRASDLLSRPRALEDLLPSHRR